MHPASKSQFAYGPSPFARLRSSHVPRPRAVPGSMFNQSTHMNHRLSPASNTAITSRKLLLVRCVASRGHPPAPPPHAPASAAWMTNRPHLLTLRSLRCRRTRRGNISPVSEDPGCRCKVRGSRLRPLAYDRAAGHGHQLPARSVLLKTTTQKKAKENAQSACVHSSKVANTNPDP